jgi:hypothetical protein
MSPHLVRGIADATAGVRFPYTFSNLGLVLLESVSVFALNGQVLTTSSGGGNGGGGNASRMSLWRAPFPAALAAVAAGGADAVRITQRADFGVLTLPAEAAEETHGRLPGGADDTQSLTATLATAHFTASAAPARKPGMLWSL